jgi:4-hydroxybenzoate polyprenyltransferase
MRPHQWVKNILLFVPPVAAGAIFDVAGWLNALLAAIAFSLTASSVYVSNDLFDLVSDRHHPRKRFRPFAHGDLPIPAGLAMAPLLLALGLALGAAAQVGWIVVLYVVLSSSYSAKLKEYPLVDVFLLASLYTIRVLAGGMASGHPVSLWLLGFSCFLFLSLGFVKRVAELQPLLAAGRRGAVRRGYESGDVEILRTMGVAASFASGLVMVLYVQSMAASDLYSNPVLLWAVVPLLLLWQCRLWLATARGYMHDDPIVYAAKDWVSWLVGTLLAATLLAAKLTPPLAASGVLLPPAHQL